LCLGLEAVLPNGEIVSDLRPLRKNNTGYDLKQLLIGAEGTLGMITAATLKLFSRPKQQAVCWLGVASPGEAITLLSLIRDTFDARLTAFELMSAPVLALAHRHVPHFQQMRPISNAPWQVLCEFSDADPDTRLAEDIHHHLGNLPDATIAQSVAESRRFWHLRESLSEAQKREGVSIKHDISLPVAAIPEFLTAIDPVLTHQFPEARLIAFGHLGDGNLHFNVFLPDGLAQEAAVNQVVYDHVYALDGSLSAEHGIGQLKREALARYESPARLAAMRAIKQALDPKGLMNPGKVLLDDPARK
jgi:FAD/FMN-containing dehydrogenase